MFASCLLVLGVVVSVAHSLSSNCFFLPNLALNGGTYDEFPATEINSCCFRCAKDPCCIAYTFDKVKGRCYMKSAVTDSETSLSFTSGLKANSHRGQGAVLRNIKITGGTASSVKLQNSDECQQYCTAYGMFSWSPPESVEERNGDCSCMTKIATIEYSFGSRSAIFPNTELD